ncbi:MAG: hypothetical protein WB615_11315 [Candidatus Tumulicola sp.]
MVHRSYSDGNRVDRRRSTGWFSPTLPLPQPLAIYAEHVTHAHDDDAAHIANAVAVFDAITVSTAKP